MGRRASTLWERIEDGLGASAEVGDAQLSARRLDAWCQSVAGGDWDFFRERLAWENLDLERVRGALGQSGVGNDALPAWTGTVRKLLAPLPRDGANQARERFIDPSEPIPFEEVLSRFVVSARRTLRHRCPTPCRQLSNDAHAALERSLLQTLARLSERALYLEFSLLRARRQGSLGQALGLTPPVGQRHLYQELVDHLDQGGLYDLFEEYPSLARLLARIVDLWVEATAEMLGHIADDVADIERVFQCGNPVGMVEAVDPGLSDPHNGRRRVCVLTFSSGLKMVYKPRSLAIDEAFYRLLTWLNARGAPLPFKTLRALDRGSHGWVEFAHHLDCGDEAAVQRYYRRAGALLCLVYVLQGKDFHCENLVACGEQPLLVDLETLLYNYQPARARADDGYGRAARAADSSVLRTGLLPFWLLGSGTQAGFDISGLTGESVSMLSRVPILTAVNTDAMALEWRHEPMDERANLPLLDGRPAKLPQYLSHLMEGFQATYRFVADHRDELSAPHGPLRKLGQLRTRFTYRPTATYTSLLYQMCAPQLLRDGVERSCALDAIARAPVRTEEAHTGRLLLTAERKALEQMDVPFFTVMTDSDALETAGGVIPGYFEQTALSEVISRVQSLDEIDLQRQIQFIKGTFFAHLAESGAERANIREQQDAVAVTELDANSLVARAVEIGEALVRQSIRGDDATLSWIAPQRYGYFDQLQFEVLGDDLYSGACGIAVFLAALHRAGRGDFREAALASVRPIQRHLEERNAYAAERLGIGGASGLASVAYGLLRAGALLDEPEIVESARLAATAITPRAISESPRLDVVDGVAGAALCLVALFQACGDARALALATVCGERLLAAQTETNGLYRAWTSVNARPPTSGLAHGAAGISYALLRLFAATGEERFHEAAREGIAYERSLFSSSEQNWPDVRSAEGPVFHVRWCHGAAGIGLARLGGLSLLNDDDTLRDIDSALLATQRFGVEGVDHLCCGNMGRIELLLVAGQRLGRADLVAAAHQRAAQVVHRAQTRGSFHLHPSLPKEVSIPGFHIGAAGIGYQLLRLAHPDQFPSILLWE